jgi:3-phosphoshikimate 1-carboxyvinyltransferase
MMTPTVLPTGVGGLHGTVSLPTSKSLTNRALVAAAVAGGGTIVSPLDCDDTRVLAAALKGAGWPVEWQESIEVGARSVAGSRVTLDLKDSGTGSRLMLALLAACTGTFLVDGSARLRERPMGPLLEALENLGASIRANDGFLPAEIDGQVLNGGPVDVRPEISSQFVSALVMAGPLMRNGLDLRVTGPLPSAPYLDLTVDVMRSFGSQMDVTDDRRNWRVAPVPLWRMLGSNSTGTKGRCTHGARSSLRCRLISAILPICFRHWRLPPRARLPVRGSPVSITSNTKRVIA